MKLRRSAAVRYAAMPAYCIIHILQQYVCYYHCYTNAITSTITCIVLYDNTTQHILS